MKYLTSLAMCLSLACALHAQECEYFKTYAGAEFLGISASKPAPLSGLKQNVIQPHDFQMSVKYGMRFIPLYNCDKGNKYLLEFEARSDAWQNFTLQGTFVSTAGGIERWFGDKGYINLLAGFSIPVHDTATGSTVRPYAALRIGLGQLNIQATYLPRVNKTSEWPSTFYFGFGVKAFSYSGVRWK